jgi:hypothetical protein
VTVEVVSISVTFMRACLEREEVTQKKRDIRKEVMTRRKD